MPEIRKLCLLPVRVYQYVISPMLGTACRFHPTCSQYACEAVEQFGIVRGSLLAIIRIMRCQPWSEAGFDPLPKKKKTP